MHHVQPVLARSLLHTGPDHLGNERTAVCCLSSLNVETWDEWRDDPTFIEDVLRLLDNVLQDFIRPRPTGMERADYAALRERSVGLGVMGFHSFLQSQNMPFESALAKSLEHAHLQAPAPRGATRPSTCWPRSAAPAPTPPSAA